jgi:phosphoenolpyruvate carboxylase
MSNSAEQLKTFDDSQNDETIVRFIKFYLEFNHIAERFHRVYLAKERHVVPKLVAEFESLRPHINDQDFEKFLSEIEIDLVFTAHPTEIFERKILKKYIQLHKSLKDLKDKKNFSPNSSLTKERRSLLLSLWLAADFNYSKPKVKDEAKLAQLIYQYSLWDGMTKFKKRFYTKLRKYKLPLSSNKNILKFSSWMGGDRDGNPYVTAKVTAEIIKSFSKKSLNLYFREFKRLKEDLCFDIHLEDQIILIEKNIDDIQYLISKIIKNDYQIDEIQKNEALIIENLNFLYTSLVKYKAKPLADLRLRTLIDRLESFGLLGMRWDVRQESAYHDMIIDEIFAPQLKDLSFTKKTETERLLWLEANENEIKNKFSNLSAAISSEYSHEARDFIETIHLIAKLGVKIFPYYIISMTRSASDLILIQKIFACLNIKTKVVPLFETLEDLENADAIMQSYFGKYLSTLKLQDNIPIMLGYSDSAKTGSRLASVWHLYLTQKQLVKSSDKQGLKCQFFHGRGGSIGRGGGPVQHAVASCPIEAVSHGFRMTIQGEVIFDRFGFSSIAVQSMMTYALSLINYKFTPRKKVEDLEIYEGMFAEMSELSKMKYRKLTEAEGFLDYFEQVTPVSYMSDLNIGSRPSSRPNKKSTEKKSYRAIPWIFGWTQNRCLLPAWYGAGTALKNAVETHGVDQLKHLYSSFFLFRSTLDLIYMTYLKIDMKVFLEYDKQLGHDFDFSKDIFKEYQTLEKYLMLIVDPNKVNHQNLEDKLYGRLEILDYLHILQIQKLAKAQTHPKDFTEVDKKTLLLTIQALASGMGNTG